MVWKALMTSYPHIFNWLAWKVGDGRQVILGKDPFIGGDKVYKFSSELRQALAVREFTYLHDVKNNLYSQLHQNFWMTTTGLGIRDALTEEWSYYIKELNLNKVRLNNYSDSLVWSWELFARKIKAISTYDEIVDSKMEPIDRWWYRYIWK